jgi:hypothetical protein
MFFVSLLSFIPYPSFGVSAGLSVPLDEAAQQNGYCQVIT